MLIILVIEAQWKFLITKKGTCFQVKSSPDWILNRRLDVTGILPG
jgi:hypothetical protein